MRNASRLLALAAILGACVSVEPMPDPKQAVARDQRIVVLVYQSPGPWIVKDSDSKAEAAAKVLPVGFLVQTVQDDRTLEASKDLQQYLPRPHYALELEGPLMDALKAAHSGAIQTGEQAGLSPLQLRDWNEAKDQLDWRRRYYAPEYGAPAARDYSKVLSLDDAVVLEVNLSFGTTATDEGQIQPALSAALRLYRANTAHLLWEHTEVLTQTTSSMTLAEFKAEPRELTRRLESLAAPLGEAIARSTAKALGLTPPPPAATTKLPGMAPPAGTLPYGMTPEEYSRYGQTPPPQGIVSTGTVAVEISSPTTPAAVSTGTAATPH